MRIAVVVEDFPVRSQTFVADHVASLLEGGHEVDVLAWQPSPDADSLDEPERHTSAPRIHRLPTVPAGWPGRLRHGLALLATGLRRDLRLALAALNVARYGRQAASLRLLYGVTPFVGWRPQYGAIHAHFGPSGLLAVDLRDAGAVRGPVVTTFHAYDLSLVVRRQGPRVYQRLFRRGDLFLAVSEAGRRRLLALGCPAERVRVHPVGIDCARLRFREARRLPSTAVRLLSVARLVEKKGLARAIGVVAGLRRAGYPVTYDILGDGPLRASLEALVDRLGARQIVHLLGWRPRSEVVECLTRSDLLLAPSETSADGDEEGIPVAIMEAMAVGVPVVSTRHAGIPELVEDGASGLLVAEADDHALASALRWLIAHPEAWPAMGRAGRRIVEARHDRRRLDGELLEARIVASGRTPDT